VKILRSLEIIINEIKREEFILSRHALIHSVERSITIDEIIEMTHQIEIIEEYPKDKYSPSCLLLGFTNKKRPLHIQITLDSSSIMKIITLYEPDNENWSNNYKTRK
jgi:hypothetical protein